MRGFAFVWFINRSDAEKAIAGVNGKSITRSAGRTWKKDERVVAVDWALSKEKWQAQGGEEAPTQVEDTEAAEEEEEEEEEGENEEEEEEEAEDVEAQEEEVDSADENADDAPTKPTLPTVDVGSTLFIRNVPFEVTEQELNTA